jgi:hypothetical protein
VIVHLSAILIWAISGPALYTAGVYLAGRCSSWYWLLALFGAFDCFALLNAMARPRARAILLGSRRYLQ